MNRLIRKSLRRSVSCFLISFFIAFLFPSCRTSEKSETISIAWSNNKAIGLHIPKSMLKEKIDPSSLRVQLIQAERTDILGSVLSEGDQFFFETLVPLTRGRHYDVVVNNVSIAEIEIPVSGSAPPELLTIYPTIDTLPENLLKIYLKFSQPMEEGSSLRHILLLKNDRDTMKGTFLDLQPELWNNDGTVLTLWLDPGRVKRDLIPNKELGTPLHAGEKYTLFISKSWKSKDGLGLKQSLTKEFITIPRDDTSPSPEKWGLLIPNKGTKDAVEVRLKESLDYSILSDAIELMDTDGNLIDGERQIGDNETLFKFFPVDNWKPGTYSLNIETRLEDLAGNNINRPFDLDLKNDKSVVNESKVVKKKFTVK